MARTPTCRCGISHGPVGLLVDVFGLTLSREAYADRPWLRAPRPTVVPAFLALLSVGGLATSDDPVRVRDVAEFLEVIESVEPIEPIEQGEQASGAGAAHGPDSGAVLADAIRGFFGNGGSCAYVVPVRAIAAPATPAEIGDAMRRVAELADVTVVCAPDLWRGHCDDSVPPDERTVARARAAQREMIAWCERAGDRIALLDAPPAMSPEQALSWRRESGFDSRFAAVYYPWLRVPGATPEQFRVVPPCGHVAGVWARCDVERGFPGPATNAMVRGVGAVARCVTRLEHDALDPAGLNCVRPFVGRGVRMWGGSTLAADPAERDLGAQRLVNLVAAAVRAVLGRVSATCDVTTDPHACEQAVRTLRRELFDLWAAGGLGGDTVERAYSVRVEADGEVLRCEVTLGTAGPRPASIRAEARNGDARVRTG
ncbi:MAG TPA: phage tail sheath subtilisin-like domain-containing protein [Jatrophihabitantaceae bacterium]